MDKKYDFENMEYDLLPISFQMALDTGGLILKTDI